jgi:hypothetical protein
MKEGNFSVVLTVRDANGKTTKVANDISILPAKKAFNPSGLKEGLRYQYYESRSFTIPTVNTQIATTVSNVNVDTFKAVFQGTCDNFNLNLRKRNEWYALIFSGYLDVPTDGLYSFKPVVSDGVVQLYIDEELLVMGGKGVGFPATMAYMPTGLKAGKHKIKVIIRDSTQPEFLSINYKGPGFEAQQIPASMLFYAPE